MEISTHIQQSYTRFLHTEPPRWRRLKWWATSPWTFFREVIIKGWENAKWTDRMTKLLLMAMIAAMGGRLMERVWPLTFIEETPFQSVKGVMEVIIGSIIGLYIGFGFLMVMGMLDADSLFSKKIKMRYRKNPVSYSKKDFKEAAAIIAKLRPTSYQGLCQKHRPELIDLLIITGMAFRMNGKIKRLASLKSIREDREAGPADE